MEETTLDYFYNFCVNSFQSSELKPIYYNVLSSIPIGDKTYAQLRTYVDKVSIT